MKLWLLDADVIIKLLEIDVFDRLVAMHDLHVASTVVDEVKYYRRGGRKFQVDFRQQYITTGLVTETLATAEEMQDVLRRLHLVADLRNQQLRHVEQGEIPVPVHELLLIQDTGVDGEALFPVVADNKTPLFAWQDVQPRVSVIHLADKAHRSSNAYADALFAGDFQQRSLLVIENLGKGPDLLGGPIGGQQDDESVVIQDQVAAEN